jgi:hypothetical protein
MPEISYLAVAVAALSSFLLGGLWYSPLMFAKPWQRAAGLSDEELRRGKPAVIFGFSLLLSLLAAWMFAVFLGPRPSIALGAGAGFAAGLFWVTASLGINYLFERRNVKLFLINGGYHTLQFTLIGLLISLLS